MLLSVFSIIAKLAPWSPPRYPVPVTLSPGTVSRGPVAGGHSPSGWAGLGWAGLGWAGLALEPWSGGRGPVAVVPSP
jgi:hypothetical protein